MRATTERWVSRLAVVANGSVPDCGQPLKRAVLEDTAGRPRAFAWGAADADWIEVVSVGTYRFSRATREVLAFTTRDVDRSVVIDTYFGTVLPLLLQMETELEVLHASGIVLDDGRVAAFCAESETGKTTLAYASSRRGFDVWADDAVAFDVTSSSVACVGLPFRMRLRQDVARHFNAPGDFVHEALPDDLVFDLATAPRAEFGAVILVQRAPSAPTLERLTSGRALAMTMAHAYRYRPLAAERKRRMFDTYLDLVTHIPIFIARFPPALESLDFLLDEIDRTLREA